MNKKSSVLLFKKIIFLFALCTPAFIFNSCGENTSGPATKHDDESFPYSHTRQAGTADKVDYMPGYAPNNEALDSLKAFMEQRFHKNTVTIEDPTPINSRDQEQYSAEEIRRIEQEERSIFSSGVPLQPI